MANTTGPVEGLIPHTVDADETAVIFKFAVGYAALWLILTAMTESDTTADVGGALAVTIAIGASFLYLPKAVSNLGLGK